MGRARMSDRTKEEIYDEEVSPLMSKIIGICKENKIAMLATFSIPDEEGEKNDLLCTTSLLAEEFEPPERFLAALKVIKPPPLPPLNMKVTKADGSIDFVTILG
jgi:hypothetical protein